VQVFIAAYVVYLATVAFLNADSAVFTTATFVLSVSAQSVFWLVPGTNPSAGGTPPAYVVPALVLALAGVVLLKYWEVAVVATLPGPQFKFAAGAEAARRVAAALASSGGLDPDVDSGGSDDLGLPLMPGNHAINGGPADSGLLGPAGSDVGPHSTLLKVGAEEWAAAAAAAAAAPTASSARHRVTGSVEYSSGGGGLLRATPASVNWGDTVPLVGTSAAATPSSASTAAPSARPDSIATGGVSVVAAEGRAPTLYSPVRFDTDAAPVY